MLRRIRLVFLTWVFKWNVRAMARFPKIFREAYPQCKTAIVTPDNFESFLLLPEDD
jgi:16S rRNA U1498 N3-methylase RsmE